MAGSDSGAKVSPCTPRPLLGGAAPGGPLSKGPRVIYGQERPSGSGAGVKKQAARDLVARIEALDEENRQMAEELARLRRRRPVAPARHTAARAAAAPPPPAEVRADPPAASSRAPRPPSPPASPAPVVAPGAAAGAWVETTPGAFRAYRSLSPPACAAAALPATPPPAPILVGARARWHSPPAACCRAGPTEAARPSRAVAAAPLRPARPGSPTALFLAPAALSPRTGPVALLAPSPPSPQGASAAGSVVGLPEDGPGVYIVERPVALEPTSAIGDHSGALAVLHAGTLVRVLAVARVSTRIRGRIEHPPGWISLLDTEDGYRWAAKQAAQAPTIAPAASPPAGATRPSSRWRRARDEAAASRPGEAWNAGEAAVRAAADELNIESELGSGSSSSEAGA